MFEVVEVGPGRRRTVRLKLQAIADMVLSEQRLVPLDRGRYRRDVETVQFHAGEVIAVTVSDTNLVAVGDKLGGEQLFAAGHFDTLKITTDSQLI